MASIYEKAEALNAETLEKRKIEEVARMLVRKEEEIANHKRRLESMDAEIKRLEGATLSNFYTDCCDRDCMPKGMRANF